MNSGLVVARSAKEAKPIGCAIEAVDMAATVQAIGKKKRTVALKLWDGSVVTTTVTLGLFFDCIVFV